MRGQTPIMIVGLGLTTEELEQLKTGANISVDMKDFGVQFPIALFAGADNTEILQRIEAAGLKMPEEKKSVIIDPRVPMQDLPPGLRPPPHG